MLLLINIKSNIINTSFSSSYTRLFNSFSFSFFSFNFSFKLINSYSVNSIFLLKSDPRTPFLELFPLSAANSSSNYLSFFSISEAFKAVFTSVFKASFDIISKVSDLIFNKSFSLLYIFNSFSASIYASLVRASC